ncbi:GNAT family N-acetyltransferase [Phyllobacterium salinisoli]|uniref:GNAT family N-acetyltransferase n=1 Tax=Phyllobacterium salinisoli TaxID=1899321 RepID=A0A368K709_9HYPH|nr:GNAT family N-acetyltransferase [Phyllobacterium salinisoli]RCS25157.1 GNAT family N-acetyltransferase [Phyllobacterium salinisoli]
MHPTFTIRVHDSFEGLPAEWPVGEPASSPEARYHAFQTKTFLGVWWATFGRSRGARLCLVEVRDGSGNPVMFVPLCIKMSKGAKILSFIDEGAADYNAPVLFPVPWEWSRPLAEQLWEAIVASLPAFDVFILDKMPEDVGGLINPLHLISDGPNDVSCHGTDLRRSWADIQKAQPQHKSLMRKMRNLERSASCQYVIASGKTERDEILQAVLKQKQRRFEETQVPGFDAEPDKRAFFEEGTDRFAEAGMLHLSAFKVGDEIVSTLWGLVRGKRYYGILMSFEAGEWAKYSVGHIVNYRTLEWLHQNGFEYMDHGIGDEPWKLSHCEVTVPLSQKTGTRTWRGNLYISRMRAMERMRRTRIWQKVRPLKWTVLRAIRKRA